jgi:hypothetical protein
MKKFVSLFLIMLAVSSLCACAEKTPQSSDEMINPGDKVGDFLITTREGDGIVYMTNLHCPVDGTTETCDEPVGARVNVSQGFYPGSGKTPFEEAWSAQICEMVIEGHPLNLQAFGYDEWQHPVAGTIRVWNVVIVADRPGTISVESKGVFDGEPWDYTAKINFTEP